MVSKNMFISGAYEKFGDQILDGRISVEGNLIACLSKDITLFDDCSLNSNQFLSKDGRFYFGLLNDLRKKGFNNIDEITILSNSKKEVIDVFKEKGGFEELSNMMSIVSLDNFETYLDIFYRENLICDLYEDGFPLLKEVTVKNKKIILLKLLRKMKSSQVIDYFDSRLSSYNLGENSEIIEEEDVFFDDNWINKKEEAEDLGVSYGSCGIDKNGDEINGFKFLSNQTMGFHKGTLSMIGGFSSVGKSTLTITMIMALLSQGEKFIIVSNEERVSKLKDKIIMWLLARYNRYFSLTRNKLNSGELNDRDKKEIAIAMKYWNENFKGKLKYVSISSNDISLIKKKIRKAHLKEGFTGFLLDTFKLNDDSFSGERQDLSLVRDSRELHNLANKYNLIGICTCQCGERFKGTLTMNANVLAGSKQVKEVVEQLFLCRSVYQEELNPNSKFFLNPFQHKLVNGKWEEEKYVIDPEKIYIVLFVEKNRNGLDTPNSGISYLFEFQGQYSVFKEVAKCRVVHGIIT